jgi:uncharacterized protein (TIGR02421 family)
MPKKIREIDLMWVTYKEKLRIFSARMVDAQRSVRLLDAIRWRPEVLESVKKTRYRELPKITDKSYLLSSFNFDPEKKIAEFETIIEDVVREVGVEDSLASILVATCREYQDVVKMMTARGTPEFYDISKRLYGSPKETFFGSSSTIKDLGLHLYNIFSTLDDATLGTEKMETVEVEAAIDELNKRFSKYFIGEDVKVVIEDEMVADASASAKMIKLRQSAKFVRRDLDIIEVHEGWVHMGTSLNGLEQKIAKWLYRGSPRCTATQEGLAVLMEIFSFATSPRRARKINDRVLAIDKAEDGANFLEVVEYFRTEGYEEDDCLIAAQRVFRGGVIEGGYPFTKDISYCKGFVENYNFIRACIQAGHSEIVPFLFVGKVHLSDIPVLYQKFREGIIDPPKFLPTFFRDLNSLVVWMSFLNFLSAAGMASAQDAYRKIISGS